MPALCMRESFINRILTAKLSSKSSRAAATGEVLSDTEHPARSAGPFPGTCFSPGLNLIDAFIRSIRPGSSMREVRRHPPDVRCGCQAARILTGSPDLLSRGLMRPCREFCRELRAPVSRQVTPGIELPAFTWQYLISPITVWPKDGQYVAPLLQVSVFSRSGCRRGPVLVFVNNC